MIEVLASGAPNTVQDLGRQGWLASGVSRGGAMDRPALEIANALVGNSRACAGVEVQVFPFRFRVEVATAVAVTGADCDVFIEDVPLPPWWGRLVEAGQTVTVKPPRAGARAYVAFAGGIDVPPALGSRSTDLRGRFGGLAGRGLARGDRLALGPASPWDRSMAAGWGAVPPDRQPGATEVVMLRALPAAEYMQFTDAARSAFCEAGWVVAAESNRMGYRLSGPVLCLDQPLELLSHGIMPGTVQVPPAGQPIIQLADANTCGGYPKIATVIEPDLWRLGQAAPGMRVRFAIVDEDEAVDAVRAWAGWLKTFEATRRLLFSA